MKLPLIAVSLMFSVGAFALNVNNPNSPAFATAATTVAPFMATYSTSNGSQSKEAAETIRTDVSEYNLSGRISPFLSQKISELQEDFKEASVEDCVDALLESAKQF